MHNTIAHQLLTNVQLISEQLSAALSQLPTVYVLGMIFCGTEHPFGWFKPAVLAVVSPSFLCTCLIAEHETLKGLDSEQALFSKN